MHLVGKGGAKLAVEHKLAEAREFSATFTDQMHRVYRTQDGEIEASPLTLAST